MDGLANVFARNCLIRRIEKPVAAAFLTRYHRLGSTGGRYFYGLFVRRRTGAGELRLEEGTLVAVASFSSARRWQKPQGEVRSYEWIRYASLDGVRVVGGMGKMLEHFIKEVKPDDVMSYADTRWPDSGNAYRKLGFVSEGKLERKGWVCEKFRFTLH